MNRKQLIDKLVITNPKSITERENRIIDICLRLINDLEEDVKNASSNQSNNSSNSSSKAMDDYEFNLHKHWKDDDNNQNNNNDDSDSGSIRHFRD